MLEVSSLVGLLVLHVFILLKEVMELMVEVDLGMLHGYEHLQLFFEAEHDLVSHVLLLNEDIDVASEGLDVTVTPVLNAVLIRVFTYFINRDCNAVHSKLISRLGFSNQAELLLNVSTRP